MTTTRAHIRRLIEATGKYKLHAENTEGANAYAFHAHHLPLDQPVFLKVLDAVPDGDLFAEPRLLVEATKAVQSDSNLVRVYDAERLGNDYILVAMEYVEGGSVFSRLSSGPLPLMEAISAGVGILHGLAQLHQALLVHRDIKPANVLLSQRWGRIWAKITDFGSVARLTHAEATVTASRHSALYVPPEGWATPSRFDVRSDLYQAGLVLFEMVHGPLPSGDDTYLDRRAKRELQTLAATSNDIDQFERSRVVDRALARAASGHGVIQFGKVQPYATQNLKKIINKATASNPKARYQKPSDMIGELEGLRLPDWRPSPCGQQYAAQRWVGWDWSVERDMKQPGQWVIRRRRQAAVTFRRWATAKSAREACRRVKAAAA